MNEQSYEFSGTLVTRQFPELHEYISYLKFRTLSFYPTLNTHWDEHFLGETDDGKFYTLFTKHQMAGKK